LKTSTIPASWRELKRPEDRGLGFETIKDDICEIDDQRGYLDEIFVIASRRVFQYNFRVPFGRGVVFFLEQQNYCSCSRGE
jgi:hypothetical protein